MSENEEKKPTIEERLSEIEALIKKLESGELDLNESLKAFEKGVQLIRESNEVLEEASDRLKVLSDNGELHDI